MNQLISDGGDCRTAPATPGLLIILTKMKIFWQSMKSLESLPKSNKNVKHAKKKV